MWLLWRAWPRGCNAHRERKKRVGREWRRFLLIICGAFLPYYLKV